MNNIGNLTHYDRYDAFPNMDIDIVVYIYDLVDTSCRIYTRYILFHVEKSVTSVIQVIGRRRLRQ